MSRTNHRGFTAVFATLDRVGRRLEQMIDSAELSAGRLPLGPAFVGVALALSLVGSGVGAFILVFVVIGIFSG